MKFAHFSHIWAKPGMTPHAALRAALARAALCDELGFDHSFCVEHHFRPDESWMSSPSLYAVGAGARTKRLRIGPMGYIVPLYHPLRLAEEIAIVDQMLGGRMELGLVPGINPDYFRPVRPRLRPAQIADAGIRRLHARGVRRDAAVLVSRPGISHRQRPHFGDAGAAPASAAVDDEPRSADARILREERHQSRLFPGLSARRRRAALPQISGTTGQRTGWPEKPNIAYCTVVYVDETDEKAIENALFRASRAYEGFLTPAKPGETFEERAREHAKMFVGRGEPGASEIMQHLFDADYLLKHDLVFIGSPETVARKIRAAARSRRVQCLHGRIQFRRPAGGRR